ncbi:hypothetical protein [Galbitalea soli]|uniref:Uncharacterized protein n=1 Tax=Galbitalea soli TaxID=1268042 RepID=A0A7C9TTC6_9MICO|nr:hypothetical protein [Galbitalea soli]NEM92400.1 hypothetical protein [Galbitalea soli]NYJ29434.1 hypothetical protein [Galbitalea soli]
MSALLARFATPQMVLLAAIEVGYGWQTRSLELQRSRLTPSFWQVVLVDLCDPYFVSFTLLTLWSLYLVARRPLTADLAALLRHGSYRATLRHSLAGGLQWSGVGAVVTLLASVATAVGLPSTPGPHMPEGISALTAAGWMPGVALLAQLALLVFTFTALNALAVAVEMLTGRRWVVATVVCAIWLYAEVSCLGLMPAGDPLSAGAFLNIAFIAESPGAGAAALLANAFTLLIAALVALGRDGGFRGPKLAPHWYWYIAVSAGALVLSCAMAPRAAVSDVVSFVLWGSGGTALQSAVISTVFLGFALSWQLDGGTRSGVALLELVRHGSTGRWAIAQVRHAARATALFVVVLSASVTTMAVVGRSGPGPARAEPLLIIYHLLVNGFLQSLVVIMLCGAVVWIVGSSLGGLITLGVLVLCDATPLPPVVPFGHAGLSVAAGGIDDVLAVTIGLVLCAAAITAVFAAHTRLVRTAL